MKPGAGASQMPGTISTPSPRACEHNTIISRRHLPGPWCDMVCPGGGWAAHPGVRAPSSDGSLAAVARRPLHEAGVCIRNGQAARVYRTKARSPAPEFVGAREGGESASAAEGTLILVRHEHQSCSVSDHGSPIYQVLHHDSALYSPSGPGSPQRQLTSNHPPRGVDQLLSFAGETRA